MQNPGGRPALRVPQSAKLSRALYPMRERCRGQLPPGQTTDRRAVTAPKRSSQDGGVRRQDTFRDSEVPTARTRPYRSETQSVNPEVDVLFVAGAAAHAAKVD
ncbi:hypothetical protein Pen02_27790 [Plantactinospora endophytica]|uniref:Uncharacterized protein n=1 Tax=Plantactinospora endophytica TaxID=673535 RepID=A0ABQ4DZJ6_9ACTN|nr:hypothetical protein Pen02_27790 [Plantactinospora endophytica]